MIVNQELTVNVVIYRKYDYLNGGPDSISDWSISWTVIDSNVERVAEMCMNKSKRNPVVIL